MAQPALHRMKTALARKEAVPGGLVLQKQIVATVQPLQDRVLRFVISTAAVDRDNDTVSVEGWELDHFRRNPVVLWAHDYAHLPVGKCINILVEGGALKADVEFVPADVPCIGEKAEAVFQLCLGGFLSATSVGFGALDYEIAADRAEDEWFPGLNFTRQELREFSIVTVPCNPEALIEAPAQIVVVGPEELAAQAAEEKAAAEAAERLAEAARVNRAARRDRQRRARLIAIA